MLDKIQKFREYLDYVERHYNNVQKAWKLINDNCKNGFRFISDDYVWHTIDNAVKNHDLSKLSKEEFTQYRQFFYPTKDEVKDKKQFKSAWENHKKENAHHWQNWTVNYADYPFGDIFLVENIVDWVAMGFVNLAILLVIITRTTKKILIFQNGLLKICTQFLIVFIQ